MVPIKKLNAFSLKYLKIQSEREINFLLTQLSKLSKTLKLTFSMALTIENVKTAILVGRCVLRGPNNTTRQLWKMEWEAQHSDLIRSNNGRIYVMVARSRSGKGIIRKIGKSECRGGLRSTMSFYQGGLGGSPSLRSFGIHHLIANELTAGNEFEIWGIWSEPVAVMVPGLFDITEMFITPSIHSMEAKCRDDYKRIMGDFPPWNFQERGQPWPDTIRLQHVALLGRKKVPVAVVSSPAKK